jgi:peptidyl-prolyl cis-trans isomerase NIMA-interacting 1
MSLRDASTILVLVASLAACGPQSPQVQANAGNTSADRAHVAAQATEPRTGDVTAAQPAARTPPRPPPSASGGPAARANADGSAAEPAEPAPQDAPQAAKRGASARHSEAAPTRISARHVLIQWMGSDRAGKSVMRTREQALVLAEEVLKRARGGEDLGRLAVEYSDEPNAGARGGSLGRFSKGQMVGAFEQAAFKLEVGQISDIVETPFGFHIIQRTE